MFLCKQNYRLRRRVICVIVFIAVVLALLLLFSHLNRNTDRGASATFFLNWHSSIVNQQKHFVEYLEYVDTFC